MKFQLWMACSSVMLNCYSQEVPNSKDTAMLEEIRSKHNLPALGGIAIVDGEIKFPSVVGLRKAGGTEAATAEDKWHIGSCTKSMTATLVATFVEEGSLEWETTIEDVLGESMEIRDDYRSVTIAQLLAHRSGLPPNPSVLVLMKEALTSGGSNIGQRRKDYGQIILKQRPKSKPGTKYLYSNSGYVIAGLMLETLSGKSWETLMKEKLFDPLDMTSAGFGGAASTGKEDQPWGHRSVKKPQPPGPGDDNVDVIGPAGTVHCSLTDLARYVKMHLLQETGPVLKQTESFTKLQEIASGNDDYAMGWIVLKRGWAGGSALMHNGSNTMNYCVIWMAPKRRFAAISVSNLGLKAAKPCDSVVSDYVTRYLEEN